MNARKPANPEATKFHRAEQLEGVRRVFSAMQNTMCSLYGRWLDEREFEDFREYEATMRAKVESLGARFVKGSKRPFGCLVQIDRAQIQLKVNQRTYSWTIRTTQP